VAKIFEALGFKLAFFWFQEEVIVFEYLKCLLGSFVKFFQGGGIYEDIVHVDDEEIFVDHLGEDCVHHILKGGW